MSCRRFLPATSSRHIFPPHLRAQVCTHICRDVEAGCPDWAANGNQCKDNPDYMNKNCPTSCGAP